MKVTDYRIDASRLTEKERHDLIPLMNLTQRQNCPSLKGADGEEFPLPEPIRDVLKEIIRSMAQGQSCVLVPEDETYTTQAAADYLGMSRQHFVKILESNQIPFHRVGSHRRVSFRDLQAYENRRDADRHTVLNGLFDELRASGHYDTDYVGEDADTNPNALPKE